jgi:FtsZ-binding cell division protein ZapB
MSLKDFDKLEEKISRLVTNLKTLKDENQKMKKELQTIKQDSSHRDGEKIEIKKKISALIELVDSIEE